MNKTTFIRFPSETDFQNFRAFVRGWIPRSTFSGDEPGADMERTGAKTSGETVGRLTTNNISVGEHNALAANAKRDHSGVII